MSARARVAFVGRRSQCWAYALDEATDAIEPRLIDFRAGDEPRRLTAALDQFDPDVVVALAPHEVPAGLFAGLRAHTVAIVTGPSPALPAGLDAANFDRIVALDPQLAASAPDGAVWRSLAPPVNDAIFAAVAPAAGRRFAFFGHWTPRRERFLVEVKHAFDLLHVDTGADGERLLELYATTAVAVNLHEDDQPAFEHRVAMHLAAGHLLISEPLRPLRGLEPGLDFLELRSPRELTTMLGALRDVPELHHRVRLRGRRKAEQFRASAVYARLLGDLERDLAAFGSPRVI
jgi:hypothetical protein